MSARIQFTLRQRVAVLLLTAFVLTAAAVFVTAVAMRNLSDSRTELADRLDPAAATAPSVLAALLDQETGLRGYALSGRREFLDPWRVGVDDEARLAARLRRELHPYASLLERLQQLTEASEAWRQSFADPLLGAADPSTLPTTALDEEKQQFDILRQRFDSFNDALQAQREEARADLDRSANQLWFTLVALAVILVGILIVLWWTLQRWVLAPVARLSNDTRIVAAGSLDHVVHGGGPPEFVELSSDIEHMRERIVVELRASEQQGAELASSNAELEQFAYVASHDLQEPLRKVASFCQMLQKRYGGQLDDRADEYIEFAVDGAKRMQELINDLLMFSRVGRTTERFVEIDLNTTYTRSVSTLSRLQRESGAEITATTLPTVHGDPTLLTSLFQNLIGNALKFRGAIAPVVEVTSEEDPDGWTIRVSDNGIGMEPQYAERVFELFQRLHARNDYEGTGIGLALCRKIVEFHGGKIWIDASNTDSDSDSSGTTIAFTLPREAPVVTGRHTNELVPRSATS